MSNQPIAPGDVKSETTDVPEPIVREPETAPVHAVGEFAAVAPLPVPLPMEETASSPEVAIGQVELASATTDVTDGARPVAESNQLNGTQPKGVASGFPLLVPVILWLLIAAGVVAAVVQGWTRFNPKYQFGLIQPTGTIFSEFDHALAITGWNASWRITVWALAAVAILAGLAATGFALFAANDEPGAVVRDPE